MHESFQKLLEEYVHYLDFTFDQAKSVAWLKETLLKTTRDDKMTMY